MIKFRVYYSDGTVQVLEATSATQARYVAGALAKENGLLVRKVKVNRAE